MNNLARVALLAMGAMAAKKYMNQQQTQRQIYTPGSPDPTVDPQSSGANADLLDANGQPVHAGTGSQSPLQSLRSNPNLAWIADPELRSRNIERVRQLWAQRHQR